MRFDTGRGYLIFEPGRGQSSCGLRDAPRVCWLSELRFGPGRGQSSCGLRDAPRVCSVRWNSQLSKKMCLSLSSCRKPKSQEGNKSLVHELKKVVSVSSNSEFLCICIYYKNAKNVFIWFFCLIWRNKMLGLINTNAIVEQEIYACYLPLIWRNKEIVTFPRLFVSKGNLRVPPE